MLRITIHDLRSDARRALSAAKGFLRRRFARAPWVCGLAVVLATVAVMPVSVAQNGREAYRIGAVRVDDGPVIDGVLDEAVWQTAAVIDQFTQQEPAEGAPATERTEARYSRDVFARSKIGGIVINKEATGGSRFNRTFAADMTLALHPSLTVNGFLAKTSTPGVSDGQMGGHLRAGWLNQDWNIYGEYTDLQDNFNAEVGFVPRTGIRTSKFHLEHNPRPGRFGIRVLEPMVNVTYTTDQDGRLLTRRMHYMLGTRLENGAYISVWYNAYFERLGEPFAVRTDVAIAPGGYRFGEWRFSFSSNPSRRVYYGITYSPQTFFDGTRRDIDLSLGARVTSQLAAQVGYARNDVDLRAGAFAVDIGSLRIDYALSPKMTLRSLTQYNSSTHQWGTSARFNFIYRPGSDLYIVYDEVRRDVPGLPAFRERQLSLKLTYLVSL